MHAKFPVMHLGISLILLFNHSDIFVEIIQNITEFLSSNIIFSYRLTFMTSTVLSSGERAESRIEAMV